MQLSCNLNLKISSNKSDKLLSALLAFGVIHKERTLRFRNFRMTSSPCTYTYALNLHPSTHRDNLLSLTEICLVNYYQSKNHKQGYKIKKLLCEAIGKCSIKAPVRDLESSLRFLTVRRRWEWIILSIWIVPFVLFLIFNKPAKKKLYGGRTLAVEPPPTPSPHMNRYVFS